MTMSGFLHASRGPLSLLAGNRAETPGALGYAASEATPAARAPSLTSAKTQPRSAEKDKSEIVAGGRKITLLPLLARSRLD